MNKKSRRGLKRTNRKSLRKRGGAAASYTPSNAQLYNAFMTLRSLNPANQPKQHTAMEFLRQRQKYSIYLMLKILYNYEKEPSKNDVKYLFDNIPEAAIQEFDTMVKVNTNKTGQQKPITKQNIRNLLDKYLLLKF